MSEPDDQFARFELGHTFSDGRSEVFVRRGNATLHSDVVNLSSMKGREKLLHGCKAKLPGLLGDDLTDVEPKLVELASTVSQQRTSGLEPVARTRDDLVRARDAAGDAALAAMPDEVVTAAEQMLDDPQLIERVQQDLSAVGIVGEEPLRLGTYTIGTSRKLDEPLAGIVAGPSSAGKSHVIEHSANLIPPEGQLRTTDLSANALYYVEDDALVHTFVVAGERARREDNEQAEATRALREMISSKVLRKTIPEKSESGRFVSRTIERHGPIAFIESTTSVKIFDEDRNRALLLAADESPKQTRLVIANAAWQAAAGRPDTLAIIQLHHALQRILRRVTVRVPFAEAIADRMPDGRPEARRAINHTLSVIRTIALLHQRQRHPAGHDIEHGLLIDATPQDYAIARDLLIPPLGRLLGSDLTPAIANFGRRIVQSWTGRNFTGTQAAEKDETIKVADVARRYLNALATSGIVEVVEVGRGGKPNVYKVLKDVPEPGAAWLPTIEELRSAGIDRLTPSGFIPGPAGRQLGDAPKTADSSLMPSEGRRPASADRHDPSGRQRDSGQGEQDTLTTCRNAGDQEGWSPADGVDDRANQGDTALEAGDDLCAADTPTRSASPAAVDDLLDALEKGKRGDELLKERLAIEGEVGFARRCEIEELLLRDLKDNVHAG